MFYNKITICGNIVQKDRLARSKNGVSYLKMILETEDAYRSNNTCTFTVMCFNKVAENCSAYLKIGDNIIVEGGLSNQEQKNQSGDSIFKYVIIGTYVVFPNKNKSQKMYVNSQSKEPNMSPEEVAMYFGTSDNSYAKPYEPNIKQDIEEDLEWEKKTFGRNRDDSVKTYKLKDNNEEIDSYFNEEEASEDNKENNKENNEENNAYKTGPSEDIDKPDPYKYRGQDNQYTFTDNNGTIYTEF